MDQRFERVHGKTFSRSAPSKLMADCDELMALERGRIDVIEQVKASFCRCDGRAISWQQHGYASLSSDALSNGSSSSDIERCNALQLSVRQFKQQYEATGKPLIITGLSDSWAAQSEWNFATLLERFPQAQLKVSHDDEGYALKVKLQSLMQYWKHQADDSPLYAFDNGWDQDGELRALLHEYQTPQYFRDDFFDLLDEFHIERPPYRWLLMGPARSGTKLHFDPLECSAWLTVLQGSKRWVLFEPHIEASRIESDDDDDEAVTYFLSRLPAIRAELSNAGEKVYEFLQRAGETLFVPRGWWHAVLNIDDTIAITHKYAPVDTEQLLAYPVSERQAVVRAALDSLEHRYPGAMSKMIRGTQTKKDSRGAKTNKDAEGLVAGECSARLSRKRRHSTSATQSQ